MTELSDYRRMIEKPNLERLDRMIRNQSATIVRMRTAIADYLAVFDRCGGSEAVSADEFAEARANMRAALTGDRRDG